MVQIIEGWVHSENVSHSKKRKLLSLQVAMADVYILAETE
jgi:hypothetical protein